MKKIFLFLSIVTLLSSCESGTKVTGTLTGDNVAGFSELQVFVNRMPLLKTPVPVKNGQFTFKLPTPPTEQTTPWLNKDGTEHVRLAEAEILMDDKVSISPYQLIGIEDKPEIICPETSIYRFFYADRDADMSGWSNNPHSSFFNWVIAAWLEPSNVNVKWDGFMKKGWNIVEFSATRTKKYGGEQRSGRAKVVKSLPEFAIWQTRESLVIKPPPTGRFNGTVSAVTKYKIIEMSYGRSLFFKDAGWTVSPVNGKCRFSLPDPPQSVMASDYCLWRLFSDHGINTGDLDAGAGFGSKKKIVDIGFSTSSVNNYGMTESSDIKSWYSGGEVIFVYSNNDLIITGKYNRYAINLNFKKGWNTVLLNYNKADKYGVVPFETVEINGDIEFI
jgi:hypothetical protein